MKKTRLYLHRLTLIAVYCCGLTALGAEDLSLDQILNRMDAVGTDLKSMQAAIHQKKWTAILEEFLNVIDVDPGWL
ncbi:MAG: hypothetical protein ACWGQW_10230, partial [bacterium]